MRYILYLGPESNPNLSESGFMGVQEWCARFSRATSEGVSIPCYSNSGALIYSELGRSSMNQYQRYLSDVEDHMWTNGDGSYSRAKYGLALEMAVCSYEETLILELQECEGVMTNSISFGHGIHSQHYLSVIVPICDNHVTVSPEEVLEFIERMSEKRSAVNIIQLLNAIQSEEDALTHLEGTSTIDKKRLILQFIRHDESCANENGWFGLAQLSDRLGIGQDELEEIIQDCQEEIEIYDNRVRAYYGHTFPIVFNQSIIPTGDLHCDISDDEFVDLLANGSLRPGIFSWVYLYNDQPYLSPGPSDTITLEIDASRMVGEGYRFYSSGQAILCDEVPIRYVRRTLYPMVGKVGDGGASGE